MIGTISEVLNNDVGSRPIIVKFQNSELQEGEERRIQTKIFKKSQHKTIVAAATKNILYTGQIDKKSEKDNLYNRYLIIKNKRTGKVKMVTVDSVMVSPQFNSKRKSNEINKPDNFNTSMNLLNKEFGSKRIKRITEQRERLKMNIDDVKDQLEQTVAGIELDESEPFIAQNSEESSYRPPINRNGSILEQVYVLHDIVPEYVLDSLEEEANFHLEADLDTLELSQPIKEKIAELQNSSSNATLEKCKLMLYIEYLIRYINKPARIITKKFVLCESSQETNKHILDNFSVTSSTGRNRPISMRDKTICYILVLSMIAFNYELDIELLSKAVKLGVKKLQEMGRILAFSPHSKNKSMMTLKLPLPAPVSLSPKKRKR